MMIPRKVREVGDTPSSTTESIAKDLADYRKEAAWILLGEPGAGKTTALQQEAEATGGKFLSIKNFICSDIKDVWKDKILFLDALDEFRGSTDKQGILCEIANKLNKLGNPSFRLSCRAADWFGASDRKDLEDPSPDHKIMELTLEPLSSEDIFSILKSNPKISDPQDFLEHAKKNGIEPLLTNPQTLELLIQAVQDQNVWPSSRREVFQLACEKLAQENNKNHRDNESSDPISIEKILESAGYLCAVLLLSNKTGIAFDIDAADLSFPALQDYKPFDLKIARRAVRRTLFRPETEKTERVVPCHRSVAEYLAARWLAYQVDQKKLPFQRLKNLLCGSGERAVAGLRGLYAWLAVHIHSSTLLAQLMMADPLTVIIYGDIKDFSIQDKTKLLEGLKKESVDAPIHMDARFSGLALPEFEAEYRSVLTTVTSGNQNYIGYVFAIISERSLGFQDALFDIIRDYRWQNHYRSRALEIWLKKAKPQEAIKLLDDINQNCRMKHNDFNSDYLVIILWEHLWHVFEVDGEGLSSEALYQQLGIFESSHEGLQKKIKAWLEARPEKYKALFELCCKNYEEAGNVSVGINKQRLCNAVPQDIGSWYIAKAAEASNPSLMKIFLREGINFFEKQSGSVFLSWDDFVTATSIDSPIIKPCVEEVLGARADERKLYSLDENQYQKNRAEKLAEEKRQHLENIRQYLPSISAGNPLIGVLWELACIWKMRFIEVYGATPLERFNNFYGEIEGAKIHRLAEKGFIDCLLHKDSLSVKEILELNVKEKIHLLFLPYFAGMDLLWGNDRSVLKNFSEDKLKSLCAFQLTSGDQEPEWYVDLAANRPSLVADVLIQYVITKLKANSPHINGISLLNNDTHKQVALIALPNLLKNFPLRSRQEQLHYLKNFLTIAFDFKMDGLQDIVKIKISKESIDIPQKIYWLAIHVFLNPQEDQTVLWQYLKEGNVEKRVKCFSRFLGEWGTLGDWGIGPLPVTLAGKIIELLVPYADMKELQGSRWERVGEISFNGDQLRALIHYLGYLTTEAAEKELERLIAIDELAKIRPELISLREQQKRRQHEERFSFQDVQEVASVLSNQAPISVRDLALLVVDVLDDIANDLRSQNDDAIKFFWHIDSYNRPLKWQQDIEHSGPHPENACRDFLLRLMREKLEPHGIEVQPEQTHHDGNRADITISYRNSISHFNVSIEIKRDCNPELWTALRTQLIGQYSTAKGADDYGIYLVLWFGKNGKGIALPKDGDSRPKSPDELKERLEAQLKASERQRIFVRVLDVSC